MSPEIASHNCFDSVLEYWWTLESLNFSDIPKLDVKKNVRVIRGDQDWPWNNGKFQRHKYKGTECTWRHNVYLGVTESCRLVDEIFQLFGEEIPDIGSLKNRKKTAMAALVVDEAGRLFTKITDSEVEKEPATQTLSDNHSPSITTDDIAFSTFPWAMKRLEAVAKGKVWTAENHEALCDKALIDIDSRFAQDMDPTNGDGIDFNVARVRDILSAWLTATGWKGSCDELAYVESFRISIKNNEDTAAHPPLLNSFFLADLERVRGEIRTGSIGSALGKYLRAPLLSENEKSNRKSIQENKYSNYWLNPQRWTAGAWPHKGAHSLVYAQQRAVNAVWHELAETNEGGIFAINGPPGTGKTTLVSDLVAMVVTNRAKVISQLRSVSDAFGAAVIINGDLTIRPLKNELLGHEIVVASANNGAVQNVTQELPALKKVDSDWFAKQSKVDYRHFSSIASCVLNPTPRIDALSHNDDENVNDERIEAWGLIASVLGNMKNRSVFVSALWHEQDPQRGFRAFVESVVKEPNEKNNVNFGMAQKRFLIAQEEERKCREKVIKYANDIAIHDKCLREIENIKILFAQNKSAFAFANQKFANQKATLIVIQENCSITRQYYQIAIASLACARAEESIIIAQQLQDQVIRDIEHKDNQCSHIVTELEMLHSNEQRLKTQLTVQLSQKPVFWKFWFRCLAALQWDQETTQYKQDYKIICTSIGRLERDRSAIRERLLELHQQEAKHQNSCLALEEHKKAAITIHQNALAGLPDNAPKWVLLSRDMDQAELTQKVTAIGDDVARLEQDLRAAKYSLAALENRVITCQNAVSDVKSKLSQQEILLAGIADKVREAYIGRKVIDAEFWKLSESERAQSSPWIDEDWRKARIRLFLEGLALHRAFIYTAWRKGISDNVKAVATLLSGRLPSDAQEYLSSIWGTLFLVTPVISTTFASCDNLFRGLKNQSLGWLVIDEAGQATPQMAVGALWRARRAVVVGDPYQIPPVVTLPERLLGIICKQLKVSTDYIPGTTSVQKLADESSTWGAIFGVKKLWVGSPLVVHRRCLDPMFSVANSISYRDAMVQGRKADDDFIPLFGMSAWVDINAPATNENWIEEEGRLAIEMARYAWNKREQNSLYFITPFRSVATGLRQCISSALGMNVDNKWIKKSIGTVHTFQGKENANVVFVLGGNQRKPGVRKFVGDEPNLLNVALTRARERIYVIGNERFWTEKPIFATLKDALNAPAFAGVISPEEFMGNWGR